MDDVRLAAQSNCADPVLETLRISVVMPNKERKKGSEDKNNVSVNARITSVHMVHLFIVLKYRRFLEWPVVYMDGSL